VLVVEVAVVEVKARGQMVQLGVAATEVLTAVTELLAHQTRAVEAAVGQETKQTRFGVWVLQEAKVL
jgi:hypothetical protein